MTKIKRPAVIFAIVIFLSSVLFYYLNGYFRFSARGFIIFCASVFAIVSLLFFVIFKKFKTITTLFLIFTVLYPCVIQFISAKRAENFTNRFSGEHEYTFVVDKAAGSDKVNFIFAKPVMCDGEKIKGGEKVFFTASLKLAPQVGDSFSTRAVICPVSDENLEKYNFFVNKTYLFSNGTFLLLADSENEKIVFERGKEEDLTFREKCCVRFQRCLKENTENSGPDVYGIAKAIVLGDRSSVSSNIKNYFKICGVLPYLAVSGLHVLILITFLSFFLRTVFGNTRAMYVLIIAFALFYMMLLSFSASVTRACVMAICLYCGKLLRRTSDSVNAIAVSLIILVTINPMCVFDAGMALSYLATIGIICSSELLKPIFSVVTSPVYKKITKLIESFVMSFYASTFTIPVVAHGFGYFSMLAPIVSLIMAFPFSVAMSFVVLMYFFSFLNIKFLIDACVCVFSVSINFIISVVRFFSNESYMFIPCDISQIMMMLFFVLYFILFLSFARAREKAQVSVSAGIFMTGAAFIIYSSAVT